MGGWGVRGRGRERERERGREAERERERARAHEGHMPELYQASDPFVGESETRWREAFSKLSCHW